MFHIENHLSKHPLSGGGRKEGDPLSLPNRFFAGGLFGKQFTHRLDTFHTVSLHPDLLCVSIKSLLLSPRNSLTLTPNSAIVYSHLNVCGFLRSTQKSPCTNWTTDTTQQPFE